MKDQFAGKVCLVTGAGSGIGAATCGLLAARGAEHIYAVDIAHGTAEATSSKLERATALGVDVGDPAQVDRAIDEAVQASGRIDVIVHAAGVDDPESKKWIYEAAESGAPVDVLSRLSDEAWRRVMRVNLDGTFHLLRAGARVMRGSGGAIVTVGSSSAFDTLTGYPHYAASKSGVHALSQAAAKELLPYGIRVNVVAPGPVDTGMAARTPAHLRAAMEAGPARGYATAEEIAESILYLASPAAANVVGAILLTNGGQFTVA
ncbi:SDR family NAD(P)-dependent oxidoreductase [Tomitella biformata]|uniref:SDR family NAD(P)-dependent oxidoreductase n=1 Tax=Tomitella biformata TaxID=630403 RepID=UPI0004AE0E8F|nr:SDR family NAD(P)-dependent oxidoreductase [Tomitella biformata]